MDKPERRPTTGRIRRWLGRLALVVLGPVVVLGGAELLLRVAGIGHPTSFFIPAGDGRDLLSNARFGANFFGEDLARPPLPLRVARDKPPGARRIVVLGGSAARGEPDPAFSLARTLAANLALAHPGGSFEIINTGLTAANSHVILPVSRECLDLDPDLLVVYLGNNEVVGPFGLGPLGGRLPTPELVRLATVVRATRVGQLLSRGGPARDWGGMSMFVAQAVRADDPRLAGVRSAFRRNLDDLCAAAAHAGVPVVLATVAVNFADQPPLLALHGAGTSAADSAACAALLAAAATSPPGSDAAAALLDRALALDPDYPGTHYLRGRHLVALGHPQAARAEFALACAGDALRFRADAGVNDVIRAVASAHGNAVLADVARALEDADDSAIFLDHVHFSFTGNLAVGALLAGAAERALGLAPGGRASDAAAAAWLGHTVYDSWEAADAILGITGRPPFAEAHAERDRARSAALERESRSQPVARFLETQAAARRLHPDDPYQQVIEARLLQRLGRDNEAIGLWSRLLSWYPDSADWLIHRGEARLRRGDPGGAVRDFRRARDLTPGRDGAGLQLAGALVAQGEPDEALELLDDILARMPGDRRAARLRQVIQANREP